jgi:hypothetical protein
MHGFFSLYNVHLHAVIIQENALYNYVSKYDLIWFKNTEMTDIHVSYDHFSHLQKNNNEYSLKIKVN